MNHTRRAQIVKGVTIAAGVVCLVFALAGLPAETISWVFLALAVFSTVIAPRLALQLPGSKFALSFADAAVFLTFLIFGGPAAILMTGLEALAACLLLRYQKFPFGRWMIAANVCLSVLSISFTYLVSLALPSTALTHPTSTRQLIIGLGTLALAQFVFSSFLISLFTWAKNGTDPWTTWKSDCFTSSMTQTVGAGLAGLIFWLIAYGDPVVALVAFVGISCAYLTFRKSLSEVKSAMSQAEAAEREKAAAEREKADAEKARRQEAEAHAEQLGQALQKEEKANEALRKSEKELQYSALYDHLTDLPNRKQFGSTLEQVIDRYKDDPSKTYHVLFLDIRRFKNINDSLGHSVGDKVLRIVAKRFMRLLNECDMVARLGGDEFAIILRDLPSIDTAKKVARRLRDSIGKPFSVSGNHIAISVNVGIAPCDVEYHSPEEVVRDADIAMHNAKEKDSGVAVFTKELRDKFLERVRYENDLRNALERNELSMHYQPVVSLEDGTLAGFEALLRWNHSELGNIPPNRFITIAEESGLIIPITNWILTVVTNQLAEWQQINTRYADLMMSVNISGKHLSNDDLVDAVETVLAVSGITPSTLKLEITESAAMENAEQTISVLNRLKNLGVQLSIDDFGTGYSSLSYLHRLPFDMLKIDRSFVSTAEDSSKNSEILETIILLAKSLKKRVIAEGIETEAQLAVLQRLHCDFGQGFLLSRPQTRDNAEKMLYEASNFLSEFQVEDGDNREAETNPRVLRLA